MAPGGEERRDVVGSRVLGQLLLLAVEVAQVEKAAGDLAGHSLGRSPVYKTPG